MNAKKIIGIALIAAAVVAAVIFAVANRTDNRQAATLRVLATFYPLYEFSKAVAGDVAEVGIITPASAEPHDFEPSPQQLIDVQKTKVFVYNGATFEPWVGKFLPDYKNMAINASEGMDLLAAEHGADPHYWLDPVLAAKAIDTIRDGLTAAAPEHTAAFAKNAEAYKAKLTELHSAFLEGLASCSQHTIVASHDAFSYVGKRYGFELMAIAGINPDEEPSPAKLAEITEVVRQKGIGYIFFESLVSPRLADTIATETGAKTATLDPIEGLGDEDQRQGKTYLTIQRENLAALRTALGCR